MSSEIANPALVTTPARWLRTYYFTRAVVAIAWVALAFTVARTQPLLAAVLLIAYPAWDALANAVDAGRTGGLGQNKSQALNLVVSVLAAAAVAIALGSGMNAVLGVFGAWAMLAGILQLATGVRRWKSQGAQWVMILSGAQSALAGIFFVMQASGPNIPDITAVAPYAAFGAFYFLVSAIWLTVAAYRRG